jgi:rRNA processing protein Krr1/Pno1
MKGVHKVESRPCRNMSERVIGNIQSTRKNIHRMYQCTMLL